MLRVINTLILCINIKKKLKYDIFSILNNNEYIVYNNNNI